MSGVAPRVVTGTLDSTLGTSPLPHLKLRLNSLHRAKKVQPGRPRGTDRTSPQPLRTSADHVKDGRPFQKRAANERLVKGQTTGAFLTFHSCFWNASRRFTAFGTTTATRATWQSHSILPTPPSPSLTPARFESDDLARHAHKCPHDVLVCY